MKDYMMIGASKGSLGLAAGNGWMNSDLFPKVLEHFVFFIHPTEEKQVILILDNHKSHLSLEALEFAKKKCIHILTLPPHTSHKTQPLDRTVFGPLKTYFNAAANALMLQHPGKISPSITWQP
ncbi:tigger transposable element-derived protein [Elysia marginata]|uniref:Tigger transposable element-derived protein n=1 Tax=Elysia marginata TaxID=1093978 RepID=A0AAV4G699_9GAST|nr:tigger transposable element-derived protein [Elysia marginata]